MPLAAPEGSRSELEEPHPEVCQLSSPDPSLFAGIRIPLIVMFRITQAAIEAIIHQHCDDGLYDASFLESCNPCDICWQLGNSPRQLQFISRIDCCMLVPISRHQSMDRIRMSIAYLGFADCIYDPLEVGPLGLH